MNNLKKITLLSSILILVFFSGIAVAAYEFFPYSILKSVKNELFYSPSTISYEINDVSSLIHIKNSSSISDTRLNLNLFLWNDENIPKNIIPEKIDKSITDQRYSSFQNLDSIDKLTIDMEYDVTSIVYIFKPTISNEKVIIYHQGHGGDFFKGKNTIQFFLDNNYTVVALSMPLLGMNSQPIIDHPQFGKIKIRSHNQFELLENENFSPIKFFIKPTIVLINYLENNYNFQSYSMVGISGGGWVTTLVSAIDDRIDQSFSVAGSYPLFLRSELKNFGDYEQHHLELYKIANYLDLYIMASYGNDRKFVQIFNKYDPCCFDTDSFTLYENEIKNTVNKLDSGYFNVYLDDTHREHIISNHALGIIISELGK